MKAANMWLPRSILLRAIPACKKGRKGIEKPCGRYCVPGLEVANITSIQWKTSKLVISIKKGKVKKQGSGSPLEI